MLLQLNDISCKQKKYNLYFVVWGRIMLSIPHKLKSFLHPKKLYVCLIGINILLVLWYNPESVCLKKCNKLNNMNKII